MLSFIIPTLNEEKVLEKLLKNLREIKTHSYEIIVSDGGSTDKTLEIAGRLADKVVVYNLPARQTIGQARNLGAAQATGEFMVTLDADVYIPDPDRFFARALGHFKKNSNLLGLGGWVKVFSQLETFGDKIGYGLFSNSAVYLYNNILKTGYNVGEFGIIKMEAFRQLKGYREDLPVNEDGELFSRLAKIGQTKTDPKLLVYHTGRRPHATGWPKLLWSWVTNYISLVVFNRSVDKEWKVIR